MTPRLAVTQEQATSLFVTGPDTYTLLPITLRFPERPTMPCPDTLHVHRVPIPEGTRVGVGSWEHGEDTMGFWMKWHPVATATLTEVHAALADGQPYRWYVTLSDIKPVEADHDEPI